MSTAITDHVNDIRSALCILQRCGAEDFSDPLLFELIKPLIYAMRLGDQDAIVAALWKRTMSDHEKDMIILHNMAYLIAACPKDYGVESLTKTDVLEIFRIKYPDDAKLLPTSKGGLREFWKGVGVDLEQGRGAINPNLKKWIDDNREKYRTD